ncbi:extracellular solute-binding protein [Hypericibacter sp.]|uniref:extracellular solute-binding protein n=1 Tax=Hypericibacter sp. TaxID=2705401 RepID=UPI003D6C9114
MGASVSGAISRRDVLKTAAAAGLAYASMQFVSRPARAAAEVLELTWPGYDAPELYKSYVAKHGGMPEFAYIGSEEESLQKMKSGWVPDLMHPGNYNVQRWHDADILQPIDPSRVTTWPDMFEPIRKEPSIYVDNKLYMVPSEFGNSSVIFRTDLVDPEYQSKPSWKLLYDERYAGKLAMYNSAENIVECAALVLGMKNIFSLSDDQLKQVDQLARKQRKLMRFYWDDATQLEQALASGEVVAAYGWNQSLVNLKKQGLAVSMMVPSEGILTWIAGFVMNKKAKNVDACYDLINSWTSPESGAHVIDNLGYGSTNSKAYPLVSDARRAELGFTDPEGMLKGSIIVETIAPETKKKYEDLVLKVQSGG